MMTYDNDAYGIDASSVQVEWLRDGYTESVPKRHSDRKPGNILLNPRGTNCVMAECGNCLRVSSQYNVTCSNPW
jgi:hypothetical protein